jgi:hypothetical protein
MELSV